MNDLETRGVYPVHDLEYRQKGRVLEGSFPYGDALLERRNIAVISDRGRVRKEVITSRAFSYAVDDPVREIHLLFGHSFDRPLASKLGKSLVLRDTAAALFFRATLPPDDEQPSWMRDAVRAVSAGLVGGISPGFRVPPADVVPDAEDVVNEPGNEGVGIRLIRAAVLYELSLVVRPAYDSTSLDLRSMVTPPEVEKPTPKVPEALWRLV